MSIDNMNHTGSLGSRRCTSEVGLCRRLGSWEIKGWVENLLEEHGLYDHSNEGLQKEAMNSRSLFTNLMECNLHLQKIDMEPEHELFAKRNIFSFKTFICRFYVSFRVCKD